LDVSDNGTVMWDGRNSQGGVVGDGTYYLILRSPGGEELARTTVVVDNNRSSLSQALTDPDRGYEASLTCSLPNDSMYRAGWALSPDEQYLFFDKNEAARYPGADNGVYMSRVGSNEVIRLASLDEYDGARSINLLAHNASASSVVFSVQGSSEGYQYPVSVYEKKVGGSDPARLLMEFSDANVIDVFYGFDGSTPYILSDGEQVYLHNAISGELVKTYDIKRERYDNVEHNITANINNSHVLISLSVESYNNV